MSIRYCKKGDAAYPNAEWKTLPEDELPGVYEIFGKKPTGSTTPLPKKQGVSNALEEALKLYSSPEEILDNDVLLYHTYQRTIQQYYNRKAMKLAPPNKKLVIWLAGGTGCGKTFSAKSLLKTLMPETTDENVYTKSGADDLKWWNNYETGKHKCVVIDEYRHNRNLA